MLNRAYKGLSLRVTEVDYSPTALEWVPGPIRLR